MAYSNGHLLFRMLGYFGTANNPLEQWGCALRIDIGTGTFSDTAKQAFLEDAKEWAEYIVGSAQSGTGSSTWLEKVTAAYVGTDGLYIDGADQDTTEVLVTPNKQGTVSSGHIWYSARVFTLTTQRGRGQASHGRFYLPCAQTPAADGKYTATICQQAANTGKTFIDGMNTATAATFPAGKGVCVFSKVAGITEPVTGVAVGDVPDVQRRRVRQLDEIKYGLPIVGTGAAREVQRERARQV